MTPLAADLLTLLRRDLQTFIREIEAFPGDELLWRTVPGISNSAGNLALHVAGNLRHFLGFALGGTGYQRHREAEFAQREGTRAGVVAVLEATASEIEAGLRSLAEAALVEPFPVVVGGVRPPTGRFLLHLATHLAFHLGQAGYLRRALTQTGGTPGALGLGDLGPRA